MIMIILLNLVTIMSTIMRMSNETQGFLIKREPNSVKN